MGSLKVSDAGVRLIKSFESFRSEPYLCPGGVVTIGYGHTKNVKKGDKITETEGESLLREDLGRFEKIVSESVTVPLTQNQFDALVSFVFNVGAFAFKNSELLRVLNEGKHERVPDELMRWQFAKGISLAGLERRREAEGRLWRNETT